METDKKFTVRARVSSFRHALRGLWLFITTTHNAWIHCTLFLFAVVLGFALHITKTEWMFLILAAGFVFVSEAFNTAIEIDIDLTSPEYHPFARNTKDVVAGAVFLSALTAFVVGILIFGPYLLQSRLF